MNLNEVAPPGWGHTKAEKEKTKPNKPKSKIGGTAAAFKRALDDGRFKGLPGDKTKKEKTASMFKLMWSMKKKGDKPHYKPGTDKKYKKYQEESTSVKSAEAKKRKAIDAIPHKNSEIYNRVYPTHKIPTDPRESVEVKCKCDCGEDPCITCGRSHHNIKESLSYKDSKKLAKASVLSTSDNPKDQDRARARQTEIDYKSLMDLRKRKKVGVGKSMREGRVIASYSASGGIKFSDWYSRASRAMKSAEARKEKDKAAKKQNEKVRSDTQKHGVKFSDAKGTGRIKDGKKHYD